MTQQAMDTTVRSAIDVAVPAAHAFDVWVHDMASWWPPEHHLLDVELAETVFEPRVGGDVIDRGVDGSEFRWARVLAYEPPHRVVFSWDIGTDWRPESDPERTSEVEVRFVALDARTTRVELEHRHLDRHGIGWEEMRGAVGSDDGWEKGMRAFARRMAP